MRVNRASAATAIATTAMVVMLSAPSPSDAQAPIASPQPPDPAPAQSDAGQGSPSSPPLVTPAQPRIEPSAEAAAYAQRPGPECADFQALPGASWKAIASVRFPGPQGEVRIPAGQTLEPGAYVSGLDLPAILQACCH